MPIFVIAVAIVVLIVFFGIVLAFGVARLDEAVKDNYESLENRDKGFNPAVTFGHKITVEADIGTQLKEARLQAAKRAAALPRGANMGIGRLGQANLNTTWQRLDQDPQSAVRIAAFHGWDGAKSGALEAAPAPVAAAAVAAPSAQIELVPGEDYPVIEIRDDMSPAEKRKARIANAKAKSAAMKAAKEAAQAAPAAAAAPTTAAPAPSVAASGIPAGAPEPPQLVEITDDMSPAEKRKARIANSKAKSAYNKALKAAGLGPGAADSAAAAPAAAPAQERGATAPAETSIANAADIPPPDYIEITDDMSPDEKRKARIANAKARSAYNKALKAAGVDPKTVKA